MSRGFVMLPTSFIDEHLPSLSDGEVRLFLVIARQTLGWQTKGGGRKEWDRLTHSELKRRMGRSSAPVSAAIASLQARVLIRVRGKGGKLLETAARRRGQFGSLSFSLNSNYWPSSSDTGFQHVKTTKETPTKETFINGRRNGAVRVNSGWQRIGNLINPSPGNPNP